MSTEQKPKEKPVGPPTLAKAVSTFGKPNSEETTAANSKQKGVGGSESFLRPPSPSAAKPPVISVNLGKLGAPKDKKESLFSSIMAKKPEETGTAPEGGNDKPKILSTGLFANKPEGKPEVKV